MKRRRSDSCGRRFVLLLLWRISAAMPVYELSRHETVHEHHARLLRRRRRRRRRTMMNNLHVNVTDSSDDDDDDDDDDAHEWRALRDYQATRHLSRYEYRHRIKHGLDLQLNWDGDYGNEEDYYYEMDHPFQSLSRQPDIPNATSPHNIRNTIHSPHGHRHLAKRNDTTSHAQALWISNQNHQSHMDAYQSVPLSQGYGTHLANIWVGSPQPQRKTVIVDTGSHFTAFPCTGCNNCGGSYHTDPYFDPSKSSRYMTDQVVLFLSSSTHLLTRLPSSSTPATFHQLQCDECIGLVCENNQCLFSQSYTEGSSWDAIQVRDRLYCGGKDVLDAVEPKDQRYAIDFMFGCMTKVNGLFLTQLADGIMGMSAHEVTLTKQLWNKGVLEYNMFALCFRRELGTSKRGVAAGSMTLGGVTTNLDSSPVVYAKNMAKSGWFTVYVKNIYVRAGGGQSAAPTADTRTVRVSVDLTALNSGKGVIVDSGTTDTYLNKAVAPAFRRAWKQATGGKPYSHFPMRLTDEELARLPTVLVQCHAYSAIDPAVEDYSTIPGYVGNLDRSSPNDLLIAIPATSYMDYSPITKMYTSRLYLTETNGGVLGSNTIQGHNVVFDWRMGRIGFAESSCTYDKRDLPPEQAEDEGYPADCVVNEPVLTTPCIDTVDKSLCGYFSNNTILLGQQKWTALVESPGASNGLTCQETARGNQEKTTDDDEEVEDENYVKCLGDGVCEEGRGCQLTCKELERASAVKPMPQDNESKGCGNSYWSACDRACQQTRLQSIAYSDGYCHEVAREIRPCHTDACLRESPCRVPYIVHLVMGFHGLSIRDWTFAADDVVSKALVQTAKRFLGKSPFSEGDVKVVFSLPWYLDDDSPEAAFKHKADKDVKAIGVKAVIDISIVNDAHNETDSLPGVGDRSTSIMGLFSNWTLFQNAAPQCEENDLHRLAKVALSVKKQVLGNPSFVSTLIEMTIKAESQTISHLKDSSRYFSSVLSKPKHVNGSRLVATWSIRTGIQEKINYYGPHRPVWYIFLRFLHVATILLMTIVLVWSLMGASSSFREVWLRLGWRWRLPRSPWSAYQWLRQTEEDVFDPTIAAGSNGSGVTLEMAVPRTPRSRNGTTILKRKGGLSPQVR